MVDPPERRVGLVGLVALVVAGLFGTGLHTVTIINHEELMGLLFAEAPLLSCGLYQD